MTEGRTAGMTEGRATGVTEEAVQGVGAVHVEIPLFEPGAGSAASAGMTEMGRRE